VNECLLVAHVNECLLVAHVNEGVLVAHVNECGYLHVLCVAQSLYDGGGDLQVSRHVNEWEFQLHDCVLAVHGDDGGQLGAYVFQQHDHDDV
jgi:hypothetical protein